MITGCLFWLARARMKRKNFFRGISLCQNIDYLIGVRGIDMGGTTPGCRFVTTPAALTFSLSFPRPGSCPPFTVLRDFVGDFVGVILGIICVFRHVSRAISNSTSSEPVAPAAGSSEKDVRADIDVRDREGRDSDEIRASVFIPNPFTLPKTLLKMLVLDACDLWRDL